MSGDRWLDEEAGPLVRAYALTRGRARPATSGEGFEMIAIIVAVDRPAATPEIGPEHLAILDLCRSPQSVAEISARLGLPLVVVRVLLGDLLSRGHIAVRRPEERPQAVTQNLLREMLHGLQAL
ncbi:DUF742 domain-containing protein [Actinomadura hibisca]|uniref:DUF742 domain-containing protein n=1 Tax=Actinomadura hibisca TaxID=68565 RepID=UPI000831FCFA|nr:DUF742 domain-containing protein [Actinomadura hibisca]